MAKIYLHPEDQDFIIQIFLKVNELHVWCTAEIWKGKVVLLVYRNKFQETDFWNFEICIYLYLKISCLKESRGNNL